jgi:hypothetical protein
VHDKMDNIQCRPSKVIKGIKNTINNVDCGIKKGLVCDGKCNDYEIRVHCKCNKESSKYKYSF